MLTDSKMVAEICFAPHHEPHREQRAVGRLAESTDTAVSAVEAGVISQLEAYHAVFNVTKLLKVCSEVLISHLSLHQCSSRR